MDFRRPLSVVTPTLDGDVLAVLAGANEAFSGRQIHRIMNRGSESGVRKAADRLAQQGVVVRRSAGRAHMYSLNRRHIAAPHIEGLASIRTELIFRLRASVASWDPPARSVFLFGSVARSEAGPESDLDLLVIRAHSTGEDDSRWREQLAAVEQKGTAWTGNETRIVEYAESEVSDEGVRAVVEAALLEGLDLADSREWLRRAVAKASN